MNLACERLPNLLLERNLKMKKNSSVKTVLRNALIHTVFHATWAGIVVLWVYQF